MPLSCRGGDLRLFVKKVHVRHGVRVQRDLLRPDAGSGNVVGRQVRAVHVVEHRKSTPPVRRHVRADARFAVGRRRDKRGRDHHLPDRPRFRGSVHGLGGHQHHVTESGH